MHSRRVKSRVFLIEGLNSFATTLYFNYIYFFTRTNFDFHDKRNLFIAALAGLIYVPSSLLAGRFAQRAGYFTALKVGLSIMLAALAAGWLVANSALAHVAVLFVATIGMCFTWPTLEALVSEGETYAGLQRNVGIYNVTWAATAALAYFIGGALFDKLGMNSMFYVPAAIIAFELLLTMRLEKQAAATHEIPTKPSAASDLAAHPHRQPRGKAFLRMAWLANPFAYIGINTLIAVMPGVAARLNLSTTQAGFCCSVWYFARLGTFAGLWLWPGWHYRFRWLVGAFAALIFAFATIVMVPNLAIVIIAQLAFGLAIGLIYYSSLFYSMDVGDTKGEHGGIHEAAIGLGNFVGPAAGAASIYFFPQARNSGAIAVTLLLAAGLAGLIEIWRRTKT